MPCIPPEKHVGPCLCNHRILSRQIRRRRSMQLQITAAGQRSQRVGSRHDPIRRNGIFCAMQSLFPVNFNFPASRPCNFRTHQGQEFTQRYDLRFSGGIGNMDRSFTQRCRQQQIFRRAHTGKLEIHMPRVQLSFCTDLSVFIRQRNAQARKRIQMDIDGAW